jgi:hypothetical protein
MTIPVGDAPKRGWPQHIVPLPAYSIGGSHYCTGCVPPIKICPADGDELASAKGNKGEDVLRSLQRNPIHAVGRGKVGGCLTDIAAANNDEPAITKVISGL